MTFLVIGHVFQISPVFIQIFHVFTVFNVIYDPFTRKAPISEKNSLMTPFFTLFVFSRASDKHYFSKYWGGRMHGPSPPPQIFFGGDRPCPPIGLRPWTMRWLHLSRPTLANGRRYM